MNTREEHTLSNGRIVRLIGGLAIVLGAGLAAPGQLAAAPIAGVYAIGAAADAGSITETVARRGGAVRRGGVAVGPRGGVAVRRSAVAVGPRGGVAVRRGAAVVTPRGAGAVRRGAAVVRPVRPWVRRAYYGTIVGGVALGTIIAVTAVPAAPADNLCWFWANQPHTQGYWDYCSQQ